MSHVEREHITTSQGFLEIPRFTSNHSFIPAFDWDRLWLLTHCLSCAGKLWAQWVQGDGLGQPGLLFSVPLFWNSPYCNSVSCFLLRVPRARGDLVQG